MHFFVLSPSLSLALLYKLFSRFLSKNLRLELFQKRKKVDLRILKGPINYGVEQKTNNFEPKMPKAVNKNDM